MLLDKTNAEQTTDYFLCTDYTADEHLLVLGTPTPGHTKLFKAAGKGNEGFDDKKISIGSCFILNKNKKNILCLYPNTKLSKGKKTAVLTTLRKIQRASWKQIHGIRWLTSPLIMDSQDPSKVETVVDDSGPKKNQDQPVQISKDAVITKAKNIKRGIERLLKDVMPRYKKRETTPNDAAFVKALRKEGHLFLAQLPLTDDKTVELLASQKVALESNLPKWKDLEGRIRSQKNKGESKAELRKSLLTVIKKMKTNRNEIKTILKRVNLKQLG